MENSPKPTAILELSPPVEKSTSKSANKERESHNTVTPDGTNVVRRSLPSTFAPSWSQRSSRWAKPTVRVPSPPVRREPALSRLESVRETTFLQASDVNRCRTS